MASLFQATLRIKASYNEARVLDEALGRSSTGFSRVILIDSKLKRQPCEDYYWNLQFGHDAGEGNLLNVLTEIALLMELRIKDLESCKKSIKKIDIFCQVSNSNGQGSITISSAVMSRLANLGVDLIFDIYG